MVSSAAWLAELFIVGTVGSESGGSGPAAVEKRKGKKGSKGWERTSEDTGPFFDDGPEANLAGGVHEFEGVRIHTQKAEADDCCAAGTIDNVSSMITPLKSRKDSLQGGHSEDQNDGDLDSAFHLNIPQ